MLKYPERPSENIVFRENFINEDCVEDNGGVINGTPTIDNGATLNGTTDYFDYVDGHDFNYDEPQSFSFIMNTSTVASLSGLISKSDAGGGGYRGYQIYLEGGDIVFRIYYNGVSTGIKVQTDNAYNDGVDHDIAVTYDGSGLASGVDVYVDGVAVATTTVNDAGFGGDTTNSAVYTIGQTSYGSLPFDGTLKNISQYKVALTPEEVLDAYQADTFREIDASNATLWLPCRSNFNDGSNQVTENIGSGTNMIMGDGSTTTSFPAQQSPKGFEFAGVGDYLDYGSDIIGTGDVTVGAMIRIDSWAEILPRIFFNGKFILLGQQANSRFLITSNGSTTASSVDNSIQLGTYYFVVVTRESDGTVAVYLNGEDKTNASSSGTPEAGTANTIIGSDLSTRGFYGYQSGHFVFNSILTPTQIKELSNQAFNNLNI